MLLLTQADIDRCNELHARWPRDEADQAEFGVLARRLGLALGCGMITPDGTGRLWGFALCEPPVLPDYTAILDAPLGEPVAGVRGMYPWEGYAETDRGGLAGTWNVEEYDHYAD